MTNENLAPIIIKRKKGGGDHGHHGGAWKVAYADFVTAMMAFFLLMWLLNATTEKQKKGLADYFAPTVPVSKISAGGDGQLFGDSVFSEDSAMQDGTGASLETPTALHQAVGATGIERTKDTVTEKSEAEKRREAENMLQQLQLRGGESMVQLRQLRHVITRITDEGLVFDIFDRPGAPLFDSTTNAPNAILDTTLRLIVDAAKAISNDMAVKAFLAARPVIVVNNPVWEISVDRAQTARLIVQRAGFEPARISRISGYADRKPIDANPMSIRNNRIEIVFLRAGL